jgi:PilZ domain
MDRREHHRVQLRLPARLRWTTPFGQKTEVCETVNASRGGVLVPCQEAHAEGTSLWVTFPYDLTIAYGQPEILAKVVRSTAAGAVDGAPSNGSAVHRATNGNATVLGGKRAERNPETGPTFNAPTATRAAEVRAEMEASVEPLRLTAVAAVGANPASGSELTTLVGLRFELVPRRQSNGNGNGYNREIERRLSVRQRLTVPVRVRPEHVPWFEETMTIDCSAEGLKFRSNREYRPGEFLVVSFESTGTSPWLGPAESLLMVTRVEREPESPALNIAVCRSQQFSFKF